MDAEVEVASENKILCWLKRNGGSGVGCAHVNEILEKYIHIRDAKHAAC